MVYWTVRPVSHCTRYQGVSSVCFFGAHVNRLEHSHRTQRRRRSRAEEAVPRSFQSRVYFCRAAHAELKPQCIVLDKTDLVNMNNYTFQHKIMKWSVPWVSLSPHDILRCEKNKWNAWKHITAKSFCPNVTGPFKWLNPEAYLNFKVTFIM